MTRLRATAFAMNLALAMTAGTFLSFAFGALGPLLREDLGLSRAQLGFVVTAYLGTGGLFSALLGRPIRGLGSRHGLVTFYCYSLAGYGLVSLAPNIGWIVAALALAGISGAASNPLTNHVIAAHAEPGSRGILLGIKQSGVQLGAAIAGSALPTIAIWQGWRTSLMVASALPLIGLVLTLRLVPSDPPLDLSAPTPSGRLGDTVRTYPFLLWLAGYATLMGGAMSATQVYLPLYAFERLELTLPTAGFIAATVGFVGVPARVVWGRMVEARRETLATDLAAVAAASGVGALLVVAAMSLGTWTLWIAAAAFGAFTSAGNVIAMMATIRDLPRSESAAGTGVVQLGFYAGLIAGPSLFGIALGVDGRYAPAWTGVFVAFLGAAAIVLVWRWRNTLVGETDVSQAKGSWEALKRLGR